MSQTYTLEEVAENNGKDGKPVWTIVKGSVYDVTSFLEEHPGGFELIMEYAGKDATKPFNEAGHSSDAVSDMKLYKIGTLRKCCKEQQNSNGSQPQTPIDEDECCQTKKKKRIKIFFCR